MGQPYVGEVKMFAGTFAPLGWNFCDGSLLPISEYDTLFNLIGTTYGGDGMETFAVPDLQGRLPMHQGNGFTIGEMAGVEQVTLTVQQIPAHTHPLTGAAVAGNSVSPAGNLPAGSTSVKAYISEPIDGSFNAAAISQAGGGQPHTNFQPYLCLNFIISLFGIFPSPT